MFSKTFGYALRAAVYVVLHSADRRKVSLQELSVYLDIPHHFLGKIMQDLVRHGILDSTKGPSGGFFANEHTAGTSLETVLRLTDGSTLFDSCVLGIRRCDSTQPCPLHHDYARSRDAMLKSLAGRTIGDLAFSVEQGLSFLVRP